MDEYYEILQKKAKNIGADIKHCGYDKECIKNTLASKVKSNLKNETIETLKQKANEIKAQIDQNKQNKEKLLDAIEFRVKEILEEENEIYSSIEANKNFMPIDLV